MLARAQIYHAARNWLWRRASHDDRYPASFYESRQRHSSAAVLAGWVISELEPGFVLDAGCGAGHVLAALRDSSVGGLGLELSSAGIAHARTLGLHVIQHDLAEPPPNDLPLFDVAMSLEVAEHLPEPAADGLIDLLCQAERWVVFTAATPGQGGHDHVHEQPHRYWIDKFLARDWHYDEQRSLRWRREWESEPISWWYRRNLMLFYR